MFSKNATQINNSDKKNKSFDLPAEKISFYLIYNSTFPVFNLYGPAQFSLVMGNRVTTNFKHRELALLLACKSLI